MPSSALLNLLSPLQLGSLSLPNRVAMSPMTRGRATCSYQPTPLMALYYSQRASAGLVISEGSHISPLGRGWFHGPDIFTSANATAWKVVTDRVHQQGGRIFCQLWHAGRTSHSSFRENGEASVAASPIKKPSKTGKQLYTNLAGAVDIETPRALTADEAELIPAEFKNAARIAKEAGFDGVELHAASGYLLDGFLQSCSNERTDKWGGSIQNRYTMLDQVINAVLEVYEPDRIGVKISPNGNYNGMGSDDFRETFLYTATQLARYNLAYLHIMIGHDFGFHDKGPSMTLKEFRAVYPGTIIANVGFDRHTADKAIADGACDMVSFGRAYVSNPDLVERFANGEGLNEAHHETFYNSVGNVLTTEGYTDYPTMK